jgi:hypothetical protein
MQGNEDKLAAIKQRVDRGEYRIDAHLIAEAIIRRMMMWPPSELPDAGGAERGRERATEDDADDSAQSECSYPESFRVLSRKTASGAPATTRPITTSRELVGSKAA